MAKKPAKTETTKIVPHFLKGEIFTGERCLAVDELGRVWWVDPDAGIIRPAIYG